MSSGKQGESSSMNFSSPVASTSGTVSSVAEIPLEKGGEDIMYTERNSRHSEKRTKTSPRSEKHSALKGKDTSQRKIQCGDRSQSGKSVKVFIGKRFCFSHSFPGDRVRYVCCFTGRLEFIWHFVKLLSVDIHFLFVEVNFCNMINWSACFFKIFFWHVFGNWNTWSDLCALCNNFVLSLLFCFYPICVMRFFFHQIFHSSPSIIFFNVSVPSFKVSMLSTYLVKLIYYTSSWPTTLLACCGFCELLPPFFIKWLRAKGHNSLET